MSKKSLLKPIAAAIILALSISIVAVYVIPKYVYVGPFSSFYASGIIDHKKVGYGTISEPSTTYTVSVTLFDDDPVNRIRSGNTLAYIVSKSDWDMAAWGDTVKIKLLPNAQAQIVSIYPTLTPPIWAQQILLSMELTSDKTRYTPQDTANFSLLLTNPPVTNGDSPINVPVTVFRNCSFYVFNGGKEVFSNEQFSGIFSGVETVTFQPNQTAKYSFSWNLANVTPGVYYVRAYLGYLAGNEEATLSATTTFYVLNE